MSGPVGIALRAGERTAAIAAADVRQIVPATDLRPLPLTRPGVVGVIVRDERAIPVYRLAMLIDGAAAAAGTADRDGAGAATSCGAAGHVVVLEHEGALAGILVDSAEAVRGAPREGETALLDKMTLLRNAGALGAADADVGAIGPAEGDR